MSEQTENLPQTEDQVTTSKEGVDDLIIKAQEASKSAQDDWSFIDNDERKEELSKIMNYAKEKNIPANHVKALLEYDKTESEQTNKEKETIQKEQLKQTISKLGGESVVVEQLQHVVRNLDEQETKTLNDLVKSNPSMLPLLLKMTKNTNGNVNFQGNNTAQRNDPAELFKKIHSANSREEAIKILNQSKI